MRRVAIFAVLVFLLFGMYRLSLMSRAWHYIVPAMDDELIYATAFEGAHADWLQDERSIFSHIIEDGVLRITANADRIGPYSLLRPHFDRFDFSVQTEIIDGDFSGGNNNAFGVIFRRTNAQNYYVLLISGDGYYRVQRVVGNRQRDISPWHPSDAIRQGVGAVNNLRVAGYADRFQFYVNDTLLALCIPDNPDDNSTINGLTGECIGGDWQTTLIDTHHATGQVGVVVDADQAGPLSTGLEIVIEFDNVIITGGRDLTVVSGS